MIFLRTYQAELLIALLILVALQFVIVMSLSSRLARTNKLLRSLLTGPNGEDLEAMLKRCLEESGRALARSDELETRLAALSEHMRDCVQHVGLVRYDAYGDVSGEQSFSAALLDGHHNGAIITGLFGRLDSRCYGKAVLNGRTEQNLSDEETAALQMALGEGLETKATRGNGRR